MTNSASDNSWSKQMKYGWNNMIGLNINIPIFDNRQNKRSKTSLIKIQFEPVECKKHSDILYLSVVLFVGLTIYLSPYPNCPLA